MPNFETLTSSPSYEYSIARCRNHGHGVAWKTQSGLSSTSNDIKCPIHGNPVYTTTRQLRTDWVVIPEAEVKALAKAARDAKRAKASAKVEAGTRKKVRDLVPGDIYDISSRTASGGKVVEIVKSEKAGYFDVTVSRTYDDVARAFQSASWWISKATQNVQEQALLKETLTRTYTLSGSKEVYVGEGLKETWNGKIFLGIAPSYGSLEVQPFNGWAVEQPQCVVELWDSAVKHWKGRVETYEAKLAQPNLGNTRGAYERDDAFAARIERDREYTQKVLDQAKEQLEISYDRLIAHTGSAATSA